MCGIVGYVGNKPAADLLIEGLKRLEYRGYDSSGLATCSAGKINLQKSVGRVSVLEELLKSNSTGGHMGIAHTRWATHGQPTWENAHPHTAATSDGHTIALVHNGIIENYQALRTFLKSQGRVFEGQTDTEVLAKLIAHLYEGDLEHAVQAALKEIVGAYAIAVICSAEQQTLVCARKGSPLIVGIADNAYVVASDAAAIVSHTTQAAALEDYQVVKLCAGEKPAGASSEKIVTELKTTTIDNVPGTAPVTDLELSLEQIELGDYEHFMLKEIMEQPDSVRNCLRGRIDMREQKVVLGGLSDISRELVRARRFILTAQGTAYHAGLIGEYLFNDLAKISARCEYASEFRYRNPIIEEGSALIAISQSGETADTLAALQEAKQRGALALGAVNSVGSSISKETDSGVYLHVGPEIGVASTKAFVGQVVVLTLIALYLGRRRFLSAEQMNEYLLALEKMPETIEKITQQSEHIKNCVQRVVDRDNWLFLGRGYNYPVALEGALKLKEISYIHSEGMPAAEIKHGPIALIDKGMPVVFIATQGSQYEKVLSNIEEVKARGGRIIAVASEGDKTIHDLADFVFPVPKVPEPLDPLVTVVPLQLLAYHAAVLRGHDVDKPRNLAKSVTVE